MDTMVLNRIKGGLVAVLAGAARVGDDYDGASNRARAHYERLGADVIVVPDPRVNRAAAIAVLSDDVALIVLPGGSPRSLRDVLADEFETRLVEMFARGTAISGASAGAMVSCERMVDPSNGRVEDGLSLAPGLALPHWLPDDDHGWVVPDHLDLWGLPECGGVLIQQSVEPLAVGQGNPSRRIGGEWQALSRT